MKMFKAINNVKLTLEINFCLQKSNGLKGCSCFAGSNHFATFVFLIPNSDQEVYFSF